MELINSLITEPGHVHIRRVGISLAVYIVLMLLLICVPLLQLIAACRVLGISPVFQFKHWYVVPEVQIPLELFVVHVCFLSVLDTRKDIIGRIMHVVLVSVTDKLGLRRMLIPHHGPLRQSVSMRCFTRLCLLENVCVLFMVSWTPSYVFNCQTQTSGGATATSADREGAEASGRFSTEVGGDDDEVGPPMRRPPPGWDLRTPNQSVRRMSSISEIS